MASTGIDGKESASSSSLNNNTVKSKMRRISVDEAPLGSRGDGNELATPIIKPTCKPESAPLTHQQEAVSSSSGSSSGSGNRAALHSKSTPRPNMAPKSTQEALASSSNSKAKKKSTEKNGTTLFCIPIASVDEISIKVKNNNLSLGITNNAEDENEVDDIMDTDN